MTAKESCASGGRRLTSRERAQRDATIVALHHQGVSWSRIKAEFGVSPRRGQQIVAEWRDAPGCDGDAGEVDGVISLLAQAIEDFAVMARSTDHDGYRIAATNRMVETAVTRLAILQATGRVPRNLAEPSARAQMQLLFRDFADILRRHDVPEEALQELLALAESRVGQPTIEGRALPAAA
jgi:hypothetical protein